VASTRGGRTLVDSGRHIGQSLAELARSSIAIAPSPSTETTDDEATQGQTEVRGPAQVVPLAQPPDVGDSDEIRENGHPPLSAEASPVVSASEPAARRAPARRPPAVAYADERYEEVFEPIEQASNERLYPPWWQRVLSFVLLALIVGVIGIVAGTAIGAALAFLYRFVTDSL
jgi:hypothetical protein